MTSNLSSQITRYGVSESFHSFIDGLRDTPGLSDKKFRLADVNKMAQYLVCRNYGKVCLELCYLTWAVVNYSGNNKSNSHTKTLINAPLLEFFWLNENITPNRFRQAFEQSYSHNNCSINLSEAGLQIKLSQQSFVISPTRVGLLAVFLEFIITLVPEQLTVIEHALKGTNDDKAIKKLSSDLQKQIYKFLAEHLVQAQQQRRFRYITQWLESKRLDLKSNDENPASTFVLNDEIILSFWQYACIDESSPGYKLYASAFNDMINAHQALKQAKQALALDNANTIGFNAEIGEHSPDIIENILFNEPSNIQDYAWLCHSPKFLTKAQWQFVEPLIQKNPYSKELALSFARLTIFGQWQAAIVQAKRKSSAILQQKLTASPPQDYLHYQQQLTKQTKVIAQVNIAICHIFYSLEDSRYLGFMLDFFPKSEKQQIINWLDEAKESLVEMQQEPSALPTEALNKALFSMSNTSLMRSLEVKRVMQAAKAAFNSNNKDGFQSLPNEDSLDIYQDGYDALIKCQHTIQSSIDKLSSYWLTSKNCQANYCSDVSIFKDMFDQLYGEVNEQ